MRNEYDFLYLCCKNSFCKTFLNLPYQIIREQMNLHITLETVSPTTYELKWLYWASGQLLIQNSQGVAAHVDEEQ